MPDVVILCGGKGTRAYPDTLELPKPLLSVGSVPVVEHVMRIYAAQGHRRFVLATGYLSDLIAERYAVPPEDWEIEIVHTGDESETGERLLRAAAHTRGDRFFATYADGVGDVDVNALLNQHLETGALATVTTVPLPSQYGVLESDPDGRILRFREKPRLPDHSINGGFFVIEKEAFHYWEGHVLESDVLPALARVGGLYSYRHDGFWKSMDTYKDRQELTALAETGAPPWAVPEVAPLGLAIADRSWARADGASVTGSALVLTGGRSSEVRTHVPTLDWPETPTAATAVDAPTIRGRRGSSSRRNGRRDQHGKAKINTNGNGNGHGGGRQPAASSARTKTFMAPPRSTAVRRARLVAAASVVIDALAVILAYLLVGSIKGGPLSANLVGSDQPILLRTVPLWLVAFAVHGLYDRRKLVAASEEARRIVQGATTGAVFVVLATFATDLAVARSWVAVLSVVALAAVAAGRLVIRGAVQLLATRGTIGHRVLVVGTNHEAHNIAKTLERKRWLGYCPVGLVATEHEAVAANGFPILGTVADIVDVVEETQADAVVIASTSLRPDSLPELCDRLQSLGVDVRVSPGLPHVSASRMSVAPLDGLAVLSVRASNQLSRTQRAVKRAIDVVGAGLGMIVTAPLMLALVIAVRLTSGGPAVFRQVRVGEGGRPFLLYKIRTMVPDAEDHVVDLRDDNQADGLLFKMDGDPRVTRFGRFLRRWGLDELPQLLNVLKGEMSLVGPRPPIPDETQRYDAWVRGRLRVKPGITGLWQVNGGHVLGFDDYVRYDLFYVENWSLGLDLYALARTPPALVFRRGMA